MKKIKIPNYEKCPWFSGALNPLPIVVCLLTGWGLRTRHKNVYLET